MKLSTKGRYGVRLMLDLAVHFGEGPILLKDIAKRQNISEKYLWHLVALLKKAGLINSPRGFHGGYVLAKAPAKINLREIVSLLEGPLCLVDCVDDPGSCKRSDACVAREIWHELSGKILEALSAISLEGMVKKQESKLQVATYSI